MGLLKEFGKALGLNKHDRRKAKANRKKRKQLERKKNGEFKKKG